MIFAFKLRYEIDDNALLAVPFQTLELYIGMGNFPLGNSFQHNQ